MEDNKSNNVGHGNESMDITHLLLRFVFSAIVLAITAFVTPGFTIDGLWPLIIAAVVIVGLDYLVEKITGIDASPFGRGIVGFIVSALILYVTQFVVQGFNITLLGAIIGSIIIGILHAFIPGKTL
ncbi:MAG: phage holin family protein [Epulopiscium sp.]|nr:phage holin family protein [Candidatus Epulonipiscium sp.]